MALLDNVNNVIYWDEVNWQWLPFVYGKRIGDRVYFRLQYDHRSIKVKSKEEVVDFLSSRGYVFSSIANLGIIEISLGSYLYNGKIYRRDKGKAIKNLSGLLSIISGKSISFVLLKLKERGVLSKGYVEEIISRRVENVVEFNGKVYSSYSELAKEFGFSVSCLQRRLSKGLSLEDILNNYINRTIIKDHLGTEYSCIEEMLNSWNISRGSYEYRKSQGWSLKKILTTPVRTSPKAKECVDFNGKIFPSLPLMAKFYGINLTSLRNHMAEGETPAEALKNILESKSNNVVRDHVGNSFSSNVKMAEHWKVNYSTFKDRIKRGWNLEETLTCKRKER